jgi:hypothetical protein
MTVILDEKDIRQLIKEAIESTELPTKVKYIIKLNQYCGKVINIWRERGNPIFISDMIAMIDIAKKIHPLDLKYADINWWRSNECIGVSFQIILAEKGENENDNDKRATK